MFLLPGEWSLAAMLMANCLLFPELCASLFYIVWWPLLLMAAASLVIAADRWSYESADSTDFCNCTCCFSATSAYMHVFLLIGCFASCYLQHLIIQHVFVIVVVLPSILSCHYYIRWGKVSRNSSYNTFILYLTVVNMYIVARNFSRI